MIFTFGLTELMHQVLNWWEININRTVTRFIFADVSNVSIYEMLLAVTLVTIVGSWYVSRTRLGFALRAIGEDETVARHTGIDTTRVKVLCFAISASVMALVGAVLALRYPSIDASIAFNNTWSFQVLIAALLGGPTRPWGPALGAVPLVLLSDFLVGTFPHHFSIALGLCFVVIVYFLPGGVAPRLERTYHRWAAARASGTWPPSPVATWRKARPCQAQCLVADVRAAMARPDEESCSACAACTRRSAVWSPCAIFPSTSASGGITGLIGPNGSGKTTVLNLITGELRARPRRDPARGRGDHRLAGVSRSAAPALPAPSSSCACCRP